MELVGSYIIFFIVMSSSVDLTAISMNDISDRWSVHRTIRSIYILGIPSTFPGSSSTSGTSYPGYLDSCSQSWEEMVCFFKNVSGHEDSLIPFSEIHSVAKLSAMFCTSGTQAARRAAEGFDMVCDQMHRLPKLVVISCIQYRILSSSDQRHFRCWSDAIRACC